MRKKILRADVRSTSFHLGSNIYVALRGPDACYCCCVCLFVCLLVVFFCCCCPQSVRDRFLTGAPIHLILSLSYHFGAPRTPRHPGKLYGLPGLLFHLHQLKIMRFKFPFLCPNTFKFSLIIVLILRGSISWFFVPSFISKKPSKRARGTCYLRGSGYHVVVVCFGWRCCTNVANGTTSKKKVGVNESFKKCPFQDSFVHPLFQV